MNEILNHYQRCKDIHSDDDKIYKHSATAQECFVRDNLCCNLLKVPCFIVSTHTSKSVTLPVYGFVLRNGIKVIARDNFYNWIVSVELPAPVYNLDVIRRLFVDNDQDIEVCDCEGFRPEWVYSRYSKTSTKFTVNINSEYNVYTLMFILNEAVFLPPVNAEVKELTKEEILRDIKEVYEKNDCPEIMSWFELFWFTYRAICREYSLNYISDEVSSDDDFVNIVLGNPAILKEFMLELNAFKMKF